MQVSFEPAIIESPPDDSLTVTCSSSVLARASLLSPSVSSLASPLLPAASDVLFC